MTAIKHITNRVEASSVTMWAIIVVVSFTLYSVHAYFALKRRIRRLGSRATTVLPYKLPYGMWRQTKISSKDELAAYMIQDLMSRSGSFDQSSTIGSLNSSKMFSSTVTLSKSRWQALS